MGKFIDLDHGLPALWARVKSYVGKGTPGGVAQLDENGHIPSSQLPSYVDDVLEYASNADFPLTGESGKIYVSTSTNVTYRWSGSTYVPIGSDLALGETATTAYRGDRGKVAYDHAVTNKGKAFQNGFYKITANDEGHIIEAVPVTKDDVFGLGITIPKKLSELENDEGFVTSDEVSVDVVTLTDDVTGKKYKLGISAGMLYVEGETSVATVGDAVVGTAVVSKEPRPACVVDTAVVGTSVVGDTGESDSVEIYGGPYSVTPKTNSAQTLSTSNKYMTRNVTIKKIPYREESNDGGTTVYIGEEV